MPLRVYSCINEKTGIQAKALGREVGMSASQAHLIVPGEGFALPAPR
ncbi:MAG: hypothetical protein ACLP0J_29515 [Solirubrobacteraceae bacterium]